MLGAGGGCGNRGAVLSITHTFTTLVEGYYEDARQRLLFNWFCLILVILRVMVSDNHLYREHQVIFDSFRVSTLT